DGTKDSGNPSVSGLTVTTGSNTACTFHNVENPGSLTIVKFADNKHGGTAKPDDFKPTVNGNVVTSAKKYSYSAGTALTIDETQLAGYQFVSIVTTGTGS